MNELTLHLDVDPQLFYGEDNTNINHTRILFPKPRTVARGTKFIALGEEHLSADFQQQFEKLIACTTEHNRLDHRVIDSILSTSETESTEKENETDITVHGISDKVTYPQTKNQVKLISPMHKNGMVLVIEPAGMGKTYVGVVLAVKTLKEEQAKRIVLIRPAVETGENLGFLSDDLKERLGPYMQPLYGALYDMVPHEKLNVSIEADIVEIMSFALIRRCTLDSAFVIFDEAQDTTHAQMEMFLTRMRRNTKFMIIGDPGQVGPPCKVSSGLREVMLILQSVEGVAFLHSDDKNVVRYLLVRSIIDAYKITENNQ